MPSNCEFSFVELCQLVFDPIIELQEMGTFCPCMSMSMSNILTKINEILDLVFAQKAVNIWDIVRICWDVMYVFAEKKPYKNQLNLNSEKRCAISREYY